MIKKINTVYQFFKNWFWALPVWKRVILTSILGALGGSSLIGFFNKYALYYHAYRKDFRIPVEGVEYLDLAITLMSFAIILTSIIGTVLIYSLLNFSADFFTRIIIKTGSEEQKRKTKMTIMLVQTSIFTAISYFTREIFDSFLTKTLALNSSVFKSITISFFILLLLFIISSTFAKKEQSRKIITLILVTIGISVITGSLFNQKIYSNFLSTIYYGGGIPVVIEYRKADNKEAITRGNLLIRTNKSFTISRTDNPDYEEIPTERISKIIFKK